MAKRQEKKPRQRVTTKFVQATENLPPPVIPDITVRPEIDEDAWGEDGLTHKQRLFVHFLIGEAGGNKTKAAQLAGYRDDNYGSLRSMASETLTKPNVQRAVARAMALRFGSPDDVRSGIAEIANANGADYLKLGEDGKLHPDIDKMADAGALGRLSQIEEERIEAGGTATTIKLKFKMYDRLRALELLAKMNGQLKDTTIHQGPNGGPIQTEVRVDLSRLNDDELRAYRELRVKIANDVRPSTN